MTPAPTEAQIRAGLMGLLIGDALGVPYEFQPPEWLPEAIDFDPPAGFRRSHGQVPPGSWSDDGALALCLAASLAHCGALDVVDLGHRMVNWWRHGYLAAHGLVFDIGGTTAQALRRIEGGDPPLQAGGDADHNNGNGSLMRVLPLALWHRGSDAALVEDAHRQSRLTHGHPRSQVCCALYVLWARGILAGGADPFAEAGEALGRIYPEGSVFAAELRDQVLPFSKPGGSGYVVDTLHSTRQALAQASSFEDAVVAAVRFGHDTDTTACVTGGLAGLIYGLEGIPARWRLGLVDAPTYQPVVDALVDALQ